MTQQIKNLVILPGMDLEMNGPSVLLERVIPVGWSIKSALLELKANTHKAGNIQPGFGCVANNSSTLTKIQKFSTFSLIFRRDAGCSIK